MCCNCIVAIKGVLFIACVAHPLSGTVVALAYGPIPRQSAFSPGFRLKIARVSEILSKECMSFLFNNHVGLSSD